MRFKKIVSGLLASALIVTSVFAGNVTTVNAATEGETSEIEVLADINTQAETAVVADYDLSKVENKLLTDKSGKNNHATLQGTEYSFENGALKLNGSKSKPTYVEFPDSIMDNLTDKEKFTIQVKFKKTSNENNAWLFCFGSDPKDSGTNYLFLSPNFDGKTLRAGIKNSSSEKLFSTSLQTEINSSYTVNMVFDHGAIRLYWNGVLIRGNDGDTLDSGYSIMSDVVTPGCKNGVLGYIGKSCWAPDEYYKGYVSEFKIYDKAMTDEDVQLSDPAYQEQFAADMRKALTVDKILGKNASKDEIKYNLDLQSTINEIGLTWKSGDANIISDTGRVQCRDMDQTVTITGTAKSGALQADVSFELTVKSLDRTVLNTALAEASAAKNDAEFKYYSVESQQNLTQLMDKAADVANQDEVDTLAKDLRRAIAMLTYAESYEDPFAAIDESKLQNLTVGPKGSKNLSDAIPDDVKPYVTLECTSSNPEIATVDKNTGKVTGKKLGYTIVTTKVKAISDGFEMEYQTIVKVDLDIKGVTAKAEKTTLAKGSKTKVKITYPAAVKTAGPSVTYRATGAVSVSKSGDITAVKAGTGTVIVKVKAGGKNITKKLNINVGDITGASSVKKGKTITLKVAGISGKATWSLDSKGKKLASIGKSNGKLKAKKTGKVTVTAKVGKITMKKTITITKK